MTPLNWQDYDVTHPLDLDAPHWIDVPDIFGDGYDDATRDQYFAVMALTPQHRYMLTTEHAERMVEYLKRVGLGGIGPHGHLCRMWHELLNRADAAGLPGERSMWVRIVQDRGAIEDGPLPNFWPGVLIRNQQEANERLPHLLTLPAALRFVLAEVEGPVDLWDAMGWRAAIGCLSDNPPTLRDHGIHWLRVRGGDAPMHPDWVRSLRDQCAAAGVPFALESWGEWGTASYNMMTGEPSFRMFNTFEQWVSKASSWVNGGTCIDMKGRVCRNGADFMRARDEGAFPVAIMHRVGRAASGRLLDGVQHDAYPEIESEATR